MRAQGQVATQAEIKNAGTVTVAAHAARARGKQRLIGGQAQPRKGAPGVNALEVLGGEGN